MTPFGWLALAGLFVITALPPRSALRPLDLVGAGRLAGRGPAVRGAATTRVRGALPWAVALGVASGPVLLAWSRAGPAVALAVAAMAATLGVLIRDALVRRAAAARQRDVLAAVEVLVGELRAGSAPDAALGAAAQAGPLVAGPLLAAAAAAARGGPVGDVLVGAAATLPSGQPAAALRAIGLAWAVGADTGAALADVLARVAADLDAADAQRRAVAVALSGPRSSAVVLSGLPLLGIGLGLTMGAHPGEFLLHQPAGRLVGCIGVLLDAAGLVWMRRIVAGAERS